MGIRRPEYQEEAALQGGCSAVGKEQHRSGRLTRDAALVCGDNGSLEWGRTIVNSRAVRAEKMVS